MISFVAGLIAAFIFMLQFFGVKLEDHNLMYLGLFFLAIAIAFIGVGPWSWFSRRTAQ